MTIPLVPTKTTVLVCGGGPAGSYAASVLAREGIDVVLLEKDIFPRYHIGESMLPSCRQFLQFIGADKKADAFGFARKPGAAVKLNQYKREGYSDFGANAIYNVTRADFDELLLRHASESGAKVFEGIQVTAINFSSTEDIDTEKKGLSKPISAEWKRGSHPGAAQGTIAFDWLVDCTGRTGIMSTKYLKNREFNSALKNIAFWGYWSGTGVYAPGTDRENAPWFEALTDETGWAWFIPLHNGTVSVGIVMSVEASKTKRARFQHNATHDEYYLDQLKLAPGLQGFLSSAKVVSEIKSAGDYSYSSRQYAGSGYRIAGDAGAFIDPFFSSGVHLAFVGGLSAAASIMASLKQQCSEEQAANFHTLRVSTSFTRFLLIVLGTYKQITAQSSPVLSDVGEDNFDRAFHFLRPVIQGAVEGDPEVTEEEVQSTMHFFRNIFTPILPDMRNEVTSSESPSFDLLKRNPDLLSTHNGPVLSETALDLLAGPDATENTRYVLLQMNARKAIHVIYTMQDDVAGETLDGFKIRLERGNLGLIYVPNEMAAAGP